MFKYMYITFPVFFKMYLEFTWFFYKGFLSFLNSNLTYVDRACCGKGWLRAEDTCNPHAELCTNRNNYLFWDLFHPTQYASKLAAVTLYNGGPEFVTPINFAQLVAS
ncbi:putative triacylglycerol lipase [Helianthus annuus]|nr:putative triacylglycerol lipase [Helianthus annuus]